MNRRQVVEGLAFVGLGSLLLLEQAGRLEVLPLVADWWPLVIVAVGLARAVTRPHNVAGGMVLAGLGGVLLLRTLDVVGSLRLAWPVLVILLGLWLVLGATGRAGRAAAAPGGDAPPGDGTLDLVAAFEDRRVDATGRRIAGGSLVTVFGDLDVDLRAADLVPGATLQVTTVVGDVHLTVPTGWRVEVGGPELLGEVTVRGLPTDGDAPVLRLRVLTLLGDVEAEALAGR